MDPVIGPDGQEYLFPEGTSDAEIIQFFEQQEADEAGQKQVVASAAAALRPQDPAAPPRTQRTAWERFYGTAGNSYQSGPTAAATRWMVGRQPTGTYEVRDPETGQVIGTRTTTEQEADAIRTGLAGQERERRSDYAATVEGDEWYNATGPDPFVAKLTAGVATLGGEFTGALFDPTSWVGGGRKLVTEIVTTASANAGFDVVAQLSDIGAGIQDGYDGFRTTGAALIGGGLGALTGVRWKDVPDFIANFFRSPEADAKVDLEVGDELFAPALTEAELTPAPARPEGDDLVRIVKLPDTGEEIVLRGDGAPADQVAGGIQPGDYVENGRVWRASQSREVAPVANDNAGAGAAPEAPQVPARPEAGPRENPGSGEAGWDDVDWGARRSPERAKAAVQHLDKLRAHIRPEAVEAFVKALDEGIPEASEGIHINEKWVDWDSLDGNPEAILGLSNAMADIFKTVFDAAGDKVQTHKQTAAIMKRMGYTYSDLIKTHSDLTGEGGLTARAAALQELALASSADLNTRITEVRKAMTAGDMSGVPAVAEALQRTLMFSAMDAGVSSEIARAMNFRRRMAQGRFAKNDLQAASDELGNILNKGQPLNPLELDAMFGSLARAYSEGGGVKLLGELRKMQELGFWDYVNYYATASLFSVKTILRNMVGTPLRAVLSVSDRYVAATVVSPARRALGRGSLERVTVREANAYVAGILEGLQEGWTLFGAALRSGSPSTGRSTVMDDQTASMPVPFAFSPERVQGWGRNLAEFGKDPLSPRNWGKLPYVLGDALGVLVFEAQRTVAFRPTVASDEFYKALARRMELNALAYREAAYRAARAGPDDYDEVFEATLSAVREQPTAEAFREARRWFSERGLEPNGLFPVGSEADELALVLRSIDHRQMAMDHAELLTFQQAGPVVAKWDQAIRAIPVVKAFWVNFVRTPMAILRAAVVDYNPAVGAVVALGEMTTPRGRAKHLARTDALIGAATNEQIALARGGAEAELVIARQIVGAAVLSGLYLYWSQGGIRGRQTEMQRAEGILDYSVRIPGTDQWVQVSTMEPLGSMVKLLADTAEGIRSRDLDDNQLAAVMGALAVAVRNTVVEPSFLTGTMDFMEMLQGGSGGHGPTGAEATAALAQAVGAAVAPRAVPLGGTLRSAATEVDPVIRDARGFIDRVMAGVPFISDELPARRDFLGRPRVRGVAARGFLAAFPGSTPTDDDLDLELARLGRELGERFRIGNTPRQLNGEDLTTVEYSRLLEIQGQGVRIRGRTMEESIRHLITTPEYRESAPLRQAALIKREVTRYRTEGTEAARDPRSPFFMRETARRTGSARVQREAVAGGWTPAQTRARARRYGADVEQLDEALFGE